MRRFVIAGVLTATAPMPALAHMVWLERDSTGPARAYFGEPGEGVREKSGGALDRIATPLAFHVERGEALPVQRQDDHIAVPAAGAGDVRLVEEGLAPREDRRAGGRTRTVFHAKAGRSETAAALDLELTPLAPEGNEFVLLFRGAPLPKATVTVIAPPRWEKTLRTDDAGRVTLALPWAGRYVVEAAHVEEQPGGAGEAAYDRTRHVATLSFVAASGIPWKTD
jgi:uncharacterized GH25 family protein